MDNEWVFDLRDKEIVFTGGFEGYSKADLANVAQSLGAGRVKGG